MKKHISLFLLACTLTWGACDKAMEDNLPSEYASVLYFNLDDGKNIIDCKLLNTGDKGQYTFYVGKGGNQLGAAAEAELAVLTEAELAEYNENNNSDYTLLPSVYYAFAEKLSFTGEDMRKGVDVVFETSDMDNDLEADKQYVLPIRLESRTGSVNQELNLLIIKPFVTTPMVTLDLPEYQKIRMFTYTEDTPETVTMPLIVDLNENKWTFTVNLEDDDEVLTAAVEEYKTMHSDAATYQLLPAANRPGLETPVTFDNGDLLKLKELTITRTGLSEGDYLLPIRLKGCSNEFDVDTKTMYIHLSLNSDLPEIELKSAMLYPASQNVGENRPASNMLDGAANTYWQNAWQYGDNSQRPNDPKYGIWLDIKLEKSIDVFSFEYQTPSNNNDLGLPREFAVYVGNSIDDMTELLEPIANFTADDNKLPRGKSEWFKSDDIRSTQSFKYIRFAFLKTFENNSDLTQKKPGSVWLAEFKLYGR